MGIGMSQWRFSWASVQGTSHVESNQPCQDACRCEQFSTPSGEEFLVLVASDGAGSASLSQEGSQAVCRVLIEKFTRLFEEGWTLERMTQKYAQFLLRYTAVLVKRLAKTQALPEREFAATLLFAIVGRESAAFLQLGDGAIVINSEDGYRPVFWPQSGEYANMTYFVTDKAAVENLQFSYVTEAVTEIALFTDGIQGLALKYETKTAHAPFFRPFFEHLQAASEESLPQVNAHLADFLGSKRINARTDDDKTLVLAYRPTNQTEGSREMVSTQL